MESGKVVGCAIDRRSLAWVLSAVDDDGVVADDEKRGSMVLGLIEREDEW